MSEEEFRIRLNKNMRTTIYNIPIKQLTLDEILDDVGYDRFKYIRDFVNMSPQTMNGDIVGELDDFMFDIKEQLMLLNPTVGYDLIYTLFDMCLYVPFVKQMFIDFLKTFTYCEEIIIQHIAFVDEMLIIYYIDGQSNKLSLDRQAFDDFIDMFSILNYTSRVNRDVVEDSESVKEFDRKAKEIKEKYGVKESATVTIESVISALVDSDNPNYTHESIGCKTMYQVMNSFSRMCKMKDNDFMNLIRVNASKVDENAIKESAWYYNLYK